MRSFLSFSASLAAAASVVTTAMGSPMHTGHTSSIAHRASGSPVKLYEHITEYMWNYAGYKIDIGVKGGVGSFQGRRDQYAPIRLSGVVGTDGTGMTGTGFILEYPKEFLIKLDKTRKMRAIGYESLLYDYQSLRPTNGTIMPPLTAGHAEEFLRDIEIDKEIRKLPGISASEKEYIIETRHRYAEYPNLLPGDISEDHQNKVQAVYQRASDIKFARSIVILLNKILDNMIRLAKKYGRSEYGIIEDMQSRGNIIASFIGHAVKPPSDDGIVRSPVHGGGLNGEITMWSEGLSLWMNLRLESDVPGDRRAVNTGDVKLFTLNCSTGKIPMYCKSRSRGNGIINLGRFTRFVTAFY